MKFLVLFVAVLVSGCSAVVPPSTRVLFESTAVSPVVVEQTGDQLVIKYKSKTETAGVIITKEDKVVLDVNSLAPKKGASSNLMKLVEIVVDAVVDALF